MRKLTILWVSLSNLVFAAVLLQYLLERRSVYQLLNTTFPWKQYLPSILLLLALLVGIALEFLDLKAASFVNPGIYLLTVGYTADVLLFSSPEPEAHAFGWLLGMPAFLILVIDIALYWRKYGRPPQAAPETREINLKPIAFTWGFAVSLGGVTLTGGLPRAYLIVFILCSWTVRALFGLEFEQSHPLLIAVLTALVHGLAFTGITSVLDLAISLHRLKHRMAAHALAFFLYAVLLLLAFPYLDEPIF